jgi:hypothetical protein
MSKERLSAEPQKLARRQIVAEALFTSSVAQGLGVLGAEHFRSRGASAARGGHVAGYSELAD